MNAIKVCEAADDPAASGRRTTRRRGQTWSLDFTIALLLFLFTFLVVLATLYHTILIADTFNDVEHSADAVSEQLMSTGYPASWRADNAVTAGLLTNDALSLRKADALASLAQSNYQEVKDLLNTKYDYTVTLAERNGSLIPLGTWCKIGLGTEDKTLAPAVEPSAYYGAGSLNSFFAALNATTYNPANLSGFLAAENNFDLLVLEQPNLSGTDEPYDAQNADRLENYVEAGGTLLLIGNVNLTELYGLNVTPINGTATATGTTASDSLLNLSNLTISNVTGFALARATSQDRYESLATLPDGRALRRAFHGRGRRRLLPRRHHWQHQRDPAAPYSRPNRVESDAPHHDGALRRRHQPFERAASHRGETPRRVQRTNRHHDRPGLGARMRPCPVEPAALASARAPRVPLHL